MADNEMTITAYHIEHGPKLMYALDARNAVQNHPLEWSLEEWGPDPQKAKAKPAAPPQPADAPKPPSGHADLPLGHSSPLGQADPHDRSKGASDPLPDPKKR